MLLLFCDTSDIITRLNVVYFVNTNKYLFFSYFEEFHQYLLYDCPTPSTNLELRPEIKTKNVHWILSNVWQVNSISSWPYWPNGGYQIFNSGEKHKNSKFNCHEMISITKMQNLFNDITLQRLIICVTHSTGSFYSQQILCEES